MNGFGKVLQQYRLILTSAVLLAAVGLAAWLTMPRQEDPQMERRWGLITIAFPGADAEAVERLVVEPLEEHVSEVDDIKRLRSRSRAGFAVIDIELRDDTEDFNRVWDEIENAVEDSKREYPAGVGEPVVDRDTRDQDGVVLGVTGSSDPLVLANAAKRVKRELLALPDVSRVNLVADPSEQITIEYEASTAERLGLDARTLAEQLQARNVTPAGGTVRIGSKKAALRPASEFRSVDEIRATPIILPSGATVPLSRVAKVRHGPAEPYAERMRVDGQMAVGVGIVPREGINLVDFGDRVRERVQRLRPGLEPLGLTEITFQPKRVSSRISDLGRSLLLGIGIVAVVLFVSMGFRLGFVVASVVPLVALASLALFAAGGGILHQISIAALVIALGMLVDNAIVVAENVQARVDAGEPRRQAAVNALRELALPLGVATGTTLAAFIPMLMAEGGTADFTRTIPIVIMLTLTVSYVFAILVTPSLSALFLRPGRGSGSRTFEGMSGALGRFAVRRHRFVLAGAGVLVALSMLAAGSVRQQFFPKSDRNQVIVDLSLPEGTHVDEIDAVSSELERALRERPEVEGVAAFVGRSAPHFYYNLTQKPSSPHLAQLVLTTRDKTDNEPVIEWVREYGREHLTGVQVVARGLEQGPPIVAPIEIRLSGSDLAELRTAADTVVGELKRIEGAADVRDDLSIGSPTVRFEIDDAAAARRGLSRADVAMALLGQTRGFAVGQYRAGDDPVPIFVRAPAGEDTALDDLLTTDVSAPGSGMGGNTTPVAQLADVDVQWRPAAIRHRNRQRTTSVFAQLRGEATYSQVLDELRDRLGPDAIPDGVELRYGGEAEGSSEANTAMLKTLPLGILVLLVFLMAEFNSFRRVAIIMATVPLAMTGVIPGLLLGDQPFGFMSLLGVIALVGIVVNNAIVLLDLVERRRVEGAPLNVALAEAVGRRTRPILLTTATTIAGLLPLALSGASLWPPLAWAMITGLAASTALTLLVVPAMYRAMFRQPTAGT